MRDIAAAVLGAIEKVGFVVRDSRGASSDSFRGLAREAVDASGALMVLWSEAMSDPDWVDADVKLIVAAWSRDRLLMARIDGAALPVGLRDQLCHELRSGHLDRDIGNLTIATLALHRAEIAPGSADAPEGESIKVRSSKVRCWRAIPILAFSVVLLLALGGLAWFFFTDRPSSSSNEPAADRQAQVPMLVAPRGASHTSRDSQQAQRDLLAIEEALR